MYKKINRVYVILVGIVVVILCSYIKNIRDSPKESSQNDSDENASEHASSLNKLNQRLPVN